MLLFLHHCSCYVVGDDDYINKKDGVEDDGNDDKHDNDDDDNDYTVDNYDITMMVKMMTKLTTLRTETFDKRSLTRAITSMI